ncbi:MAG: OadG family protein [Kiritimatiellae bacterium]|nr:OadG family protein [Kiritimatiellia bacterium]
MQQIGQGLVLMLSGMGIVYCFLLVLIGVTKLTMQYIAKFDSILPAEATKKAPVKKAATDDDANIALAIAVALNA